MKREVPYAVVCNFCNRLFINYFISLAIYHFLFIQNRESVSVVSMCLCTYFYIFLFLPLSLLSQIMSLPSELGLMTHVHSLLLNGLSLFDPPNSIPSLGTQPLLSYLHYKHKASQAITSLRVVVVGPESVGKTVLVARLKGNEIVGINLTKGLEVGFNIVRLWVVFCGL